MEPALYFLFSTLPPRILIYLPFLNSLRFGRRAVAATITVLSVLEFALVNLLLQTGPPGASQALELLFVPLSVGICQLHIRTSFHKLLLYYLFVTDYAMLVTGISTFAAINLFHASARSLESCLGSLALYILTFPLALLFYRGSASRLLQADDSSLWRRIWLIPAFMTVLALLFTGRVDDSTASQWSFLFTRVSLLLCGLATYQMLLQAFESIQKQTSLHERLSRDERLLEMQIEEQKKYSSLIMENEEEIRRQRHDLRHQMAMIRELAGTDTGQLRRYLDALLASRPEPAESCCENRAVSAVVAHYAAVCRREGIAFAAHLTVPAASAVISDASLCIIFGNLLDNAVEACRRMTEGDRFIRLNSSAQHGVLTVTMDNSFDGEVRQKDGEYVSHKDGGPGVGLSSVRAVAEQHQGGARFEHRDKVFLSSVYLSI